MTPIDKVRAALDKIEQHFTVETINTFGVFGKTHYESNGDPIYRAEITKSELVGLMKAIKEALSELDGMVKNLENAQRQLKSLMVYDMYDCSCVEDTDWQAQCKLMYEYAEDAEKLIAPYVKGGTE